MGKLSCVPARSRQALATLALKAMRAFRRLIKVWGRQSRFIVIIALLSIIYTAVVIRRQDFDGRAVIQTSWVYFMLVKKCDRCLDSKIDISEPALIGDYHLMSNDKFFENVAIS